jgi:hypothetical protein
MSIPNFSETYSKQINQYVYPFFGVIYLILFYFLQTKQLEIMMICCMFIVVLFLSANFLKEILVPFKGENIKGHMFSFEILRNIVPDLVIDIISQIPVFLFIPVGLFASIFTYLYVIMVAYVSKTKAKTLSDGIQLSSQNRATLYSLEYMMLFIFIFVIGIMILLKNFTGEDFLRNGGNNIYNGISFLLCMTILTLSISCISLSNNLYSAKNQMADV